MSGAGYVARMCVWGEGRGEREGVAYSSFFLGWGGPERLGSLGSPKHRWDNNIKTNLKEIEWESMDRIDLPQHRDKWQILVNTEVNLQVP